MKKIVLASASPRRKQLLEQMNLVFEVKPSSTGEILDKRLNPEEVVIELAKQKALNIAHKEKDSIVIGSDTIVFMNEILGKPDNELHAFEMLNKLSGKTHYVYTGIAVIDTTTNKLITDYEKTAVKMRQLSSEEIKGYVSTGEPIDKAGAYGIQGLGSIFIEKIEGCYFNVVGLPVSKLYSILNQFGIDVFKK